MSFYTDNRPRLIEQNLYQKIIRKQISTIVEKKKPFLNYDKIGNMMGGYLKRNWSFILIILIFIFMLIYRYNIIKKDLEIKKAKKQYLDQIILDNYKKEKEKQQMEDNNQIFYTMPQLQQQQQQQQRQQKEEIENEEIIKETFEENLTFDDLFTSKLDKKYEPFYGNSSFAPF